MDNNIKTKPSKENVISALSRRNNPYSLLAVGWEPFQKGYKAGFSQCEKSYAKEINNYDSFIRSIERMFTLIGWVN